MNSKQEIGECIYCGSKHVDLSDEHILPYSLGGKEILQQASCETCARITSQLEGSVSRNMLGSLRTALDYPTYHKKSRPPLQVVASVEGISWRVTVEPSEYPLFVVLPQLKLLGGAFDGHCPDPPSICHGAWIQPIRMIGVGKFVEIGADTITAESVIDVHSFLRVVAKIGYCAVVWSCGFEAVQGALVVPSILGRENEIARFVGEDPLPSEHVEPAEKSGAEHVHDIKVRHYDLSDGSRGFVATVQLFANYSNAPRYAVWISKTNKRAE